MNPIEEFLNCKKPSKFFNSLSDNELKLNYEPLYNLKNVPQNPEHHPEGDCYIHTLYVCDAMWNILNEIPEMHQVNTLKLSALAHDFGKATTTKWNESKNKWTAYGHEYESSKIYLKWIPSEYSNFLQTFLIEYHMLRCRPLNQITTKSMNKFVANVCLGYFDWLYLVVLMKADACGRPPKDGKFKDSIYLMNDLLYPNIKLDQEFLKGLDSITL